MTRRVPKANPIRRVVRAEWFLGWTHARPTPDVWIVYVDVRAPDGRVYTIAGPGHSTPMRAYCEDLYGLRPVDSLASRVADSLPDGYVVIGSYIVRADASRYDSAERVDFPPPVVGRASVTESLAVRQMTGRLVGPVTPPRDLLRFPRAVPEPKPPARKRPWWMLWWLIPGKSRASAGAAQQVRTCTSARC